MPETTKPNFEDERINRLYAKMTGSRQKADGTITYYIDTAKRFLSRLNKDTFDGTDIDEYFSWRRAEGGISERTLKKEFFALAKLWKANKTEPWPFSKEDTPKSKTQANQPAFRPAEIDQLIMTAPRLTKAEVFYLSIVTTWACRREALSQISKRDFDDTTFLIHGVKGGETIRHYIPEVLQPVFRDYWPGEHSTTGLSVMFNRICKKAGIEKVPNFGWHSIRRTATTMATELFLPKNDLPASMWADYTGWSKAKKGSEFFGAAMAGVYSHPEVLSDDPYRTDKLIYAVHPFLKTWEKALALPRETKESRSLGITADNDYKAGETMTIDLEDTPTPDVAIAPEIQPQKCEDIANGKPSSLDDILSKLRNGG
ncbi:MAG: hypothetical protein WC454_08075 [Phycisphaerae bacterium]|jgi:integrase